MLLGILVNADAQRRQAINMDSVEIGLITCSPHEELYSLYGHTALRYHNLSTGQDLAFNYGVFNFKAPHFVLRFVFGKTDYELGVFPFRAFCGYYEQWGSQVYEQVLNLTAEEKRKISQALATNLEPQNRIYRYNFFYDNCSTRPRDIIEKNIDGQVVYQERSDYQPSYRQMIHEKVAHHPWAAMGNDLLLGCNADRKTTFRQQEFLPDHLMHDFSHATIVSEGHSRPLVKEERVIIPAGQQVIEKEFPLSPTVCALLLALVFLTVLYAEYRQKKCLVWFDTCMMLVLGIIGCIILMMFFSEHPATSTNLQVLLLNPIHLFFISPVIKRKPDTHYWTLLLVLIGLFLIGRLIQDYAEGMMILALCLLTRYISHRKNDK